MKFKHKISTNYRWNSEKLLEIRKWLIQEIGEPYAKWITCYEDGRLSVTFLYEKDSIFFALRWI